MKGFYSSEKVTFSAAVKSFDANIAISGNFLLNAKKNSIGRSKGKCQGCTPLHPLRNTGSAIGLLKFCRYFGNNTRCVWFRITMAHICYFFIQSHFRKEIRNLCKILSKEGSIENCEITSRISQNSVVGTMSLSPTI